jgi:hypothetical protein
MERGYARLILKPPSWFAKAMPAVWTVQRHFGEARPVFPYTLTKKGLATAEPETSVLRQAGRGRCLRLHNAILRRVGPAGTSRIRRLAWRPRRPSAVHDRVQRGRHRSECVRYDSPAERCHKRTTAKPLRRLFHAVRPRARGLRNCFRYDKRRIRCAASPGERSHR